MEPYPHHESIDRSPQHRTREGMMTLAADPRARMLVVDTRSAVDVDASCALRWLPVAGDPADLLLLGVTPDGPRFARVRLTARPTADAAQTRADHPSPAAEADEGPLTSLREAGRQLEGEALELALTACALANWHQRERHCAACGTESVMDPGGWSRTCPACGALSFPRHDPAMIVAVLDESDRLLLGHQASWGPGRYSLLAGFVEAAESLEDAVRREVMEEASVRVGAVRYLASQPWPFPRSLMFAYVARARSTDLVPDGQEIVDLRWFDRDTFEADLAAGTITTPGASISISAWVIDQWRRGTLPTPEEG